MQKEKKKSVAGYIIGSIVVACVSMIVLPRLIEAVSSNLYKRMPRKPIDSSVDDWGPEIVRKNSEKENRA